MVAPACIVLLAAVLRVACLDRVPPAINQDEAVHAYEAYCLWTTGGDHVGTRFPFFFHCYGKADHHAAPFIWLEVPLQVVFGMNVWTTRLPSAILGTTGVWLLYLLVHRWYGRRPALLAALLLALSPWHIHLSRLAFEVSICPTLVVLGLLWLSPQPCQGSRTPKWRRADYGRVLLAGCVFGITAWTYNAMRVFVPLLLIGIGVAFAGSLRDAMRQAAGRKAVAGFFVGLLLGLSPFIYASICTPESAWGRAAALSLLHREDGSDPLAVLLRGYWANISPDFLFVHGDPYAVQSVPGYGQLHYYMAVLLPLGLYRVLRRWREERAGLLVVCWLLVSAVPAALAAWMPGAGHALRSAGALPAYQILAALGMDWLLERVRERSIGIQRVVMGVMATAIALNAGYFAYQFWGVYPPKAEVEFQSEWSAVFRDIARERTRYDAVLVTLRNTNQVGMLYLFWTQLSPKEWLSAPRRIEEGPYYDQIIQAGNVLFLPSDYLPQIRKQLPPKARVLVAERPGIPVPGRELRRYERSNGSTAVILYEVTD